MLVAGICIRDEAFFMLYREIIVDSRNIWAWDETVCVYVLCMRVYELP